MADPSPPQYLIPAPIRRGYEFFPGWGMAEAAVTVAGLGAGAVLFAAASVLAAPVALRLVLFIFAGAIGVGLALPPPNGEPLYRRIAAGWRYRRQPHRYRYDWQQPDWDD